MNFYIIRHGNTFELGEMPRRVGARTQVALVESGQQQAQELADFFSSAAIHFDAIYTSSLVRAQQTAQPIVQAQPGYLNPVVLDFLNEIDHGPDENKLESEVIARVGQAALEAWDQKGIAPEGWVVNAAERIRGWKTFVQSHQFEGDVALVTSNGAARFALFAFGLDRFLDDLKLRTGAFGVLHVGGGAQVKLLEWNVRPWSRPIT